MVEIQKPSSKLWLSGWSHLPVLIASASYLLSVRYPLLAVADENVTFRDMNCDSLWQLQPHACLCAMRNPYSVFIRNIGVQGFRFCYHSFPMQQENLVVINVCRIWHWLPKGTHLYKQYLQTIEFTYSPVSITAWSFTDKTLSRVGRAA